MTNDNDKLTADRAAFAHLRARCLELKIVSTNREFESACLANGAYKGASAAEWIAAGEWFALNAAADRGVDLFEGGDEEPDGKPVGHFEKERAKAAWNRACDHALDARW